MMGAQTVARSIPLLDVMFFLAETKDSPKHVGGLMLFKLPDDAGKRFVRDLVTAHRKARPVAPFNQVVEFSLTQLPHWSKARSIDMKYHVQHVKLPPGARHAELLELVGKLHSQLLDRSRPMFRVWFIDGLPDRTFALYLQIHHAIIDGMSGMARVEASLATRPDLRRIRPFFAVGFDRAAPRAKRPAPDIVAALKSLAVKQAFAFRDLYATLLRKGIGQAGGPGSVPFTAPRTPTNEHAGVGRSIATLALPLDAMKAVGRAFGGTLNDVAATILDAGLVRYLEDRKCRPDEPLVAMCPVSLREAGDREATIKVSALFARLGAPGATIGKRMRQVMAALHSAKDELRGMSRDAAMLYAVLVFALSRAVEVTGIDLVTPPVANFVLSNVPGARHDLYLNGARLVGVYPISVLGGGIGLNVTLVSHVDTMYFGFVANGASLPDLDRLASRTHEAFAALKRAAARHAKATTRKLA